MRTSQLQYEILVEFMERHGDLSKPSSGPRGRHFTQVKWKELSDKLNSEGSGETRPEDKWRKVWSDLKNNTKKKLGKISKAASGTGGGPACHLTLTDLENRVIQIIHPRAGTGIPSIPEAGLDQSSEEILDTLVTQDIIAQPEEVNLEEDPLVIPLENEDEPWNIPSTSSQATVAPPRRRVETTAPLSPIVNNSEETWKPPATKKSRRKSDDHISQIFLESEQKTREYTKERDQAFEKLEIERLRVKEYEIRERARQRDVELNLQGLWLNFLNEALNLIQRYFER